MEKKFFTLILLLMFTVVNCAFHSSPPKKPDNICSVFKEKKKWYTYAKKTEKKWGIPIHVMMAIMHQESHYRSNAKPPRKKYFNFIPGPRPSSAYGYAQALNDTWEHYQKATSKWGADRDDFDDAIDFIGWYCLQSHKKCSIKKSDTYSLYLAYHEGHNGYMRKTLKKKSKKIGYKRKTGQKQREKTNLAKKVAVRAAIYKRQLAACERSLPIKKPCFLFTFF